MKLSKNFFLFGICLSLLLTGCTQRQLNQALKVAQDALGSTGISSEDVAQGLKQALENGAGFAAGAASKTNGYWSNPQIRIPLPPDIQKIERTLRQVGLGKQVDEFLETMNHGAEKAAIEARPIFVDVIKKMTIQDAWNILKGTDNAATAYLKENSYRRLQGAFKPHIRAALEQVNATKYYADIVRRYNMIPGVKRLDPELDNYVTSKALDGLFLLVAREEKNIRENPTARTTELLKKVFTEANMQG